MPLQIQNRPWKTLIAMPQMQCVAALVLCLLSAALGSLLGTGRKQSAVSRPAGMPTVAYVAADPTISARAVQGESGPATRTSSSAEPPVAVVKSDSSSSGTAAAVESRDFSASRSSLPVRAPQAPVKRRVVEPAVLVPMIFQNVNPVAAGLSGAQVATINQMRGQFNDQVGASSSPTDPQYRMRWVTAQIQADDMLRAYLGWEKFNQYQIQAAQAVR